MLDSDAFPRFIFLDGDGAETVLQPGLMVGRIRAIGTHLAGRVASGSAIGVMFASGPDLVLVWLACLHAGLRPLVMQYPTRKQSRAYWAESVRDTIGTAGLAAIVADRHCTGLGLSEMIPTIGQAELDGLPEGDPAPLRLRDFAIIQLSSGTTGFRKAVQFEAVDLRRHAEDYNRTLGLTRHDRIVSWLPLYHDMGYVACFVMPMMLGIDVVMIDPMVWVQRPGLLYDAIERHAGTICYMPNFGFEVMARCGPRSLPSMRWWISCSEPVSAGTARKFLDLTGSPDDSFAPCYAMAENIFAVTLRRGLRTAAIDAAEVVSCGKPIEGVELRIEDGEIRVRSPTSLRAYLGG